MILVGVPHHALHGGIIVLDLALSPSILLHRAALRDHAADGGGSPPQAATGVPESASVEEGNAQERYPRRRKHQIGASISDGSHHFASPCSIESRSLNDRCRRAEQFQWDPRATLPYTAPKQKK